MCCSRPAVTVIMLALAIGSPTALGLDGPCPQFNYLPGAQICADVSVSGSPTFHEEDEICYEDGSIVDLPRSIVVSVSDSAEACCPEECGGAGRCSDASGSAATQLTVADPLPVEFSVQLVNDTRAVSGSVTDHWDCMLVKCVYEWLRDDIWCQPVPPGSTAAGGSYVLVPFELTATRTITLQAGGFIGCGECGDPECFYARVCSGAQGAGCADPELELTAPGQVSASLDPGDYRIITSLRATLACDTDECNSDYDCSCSDDVTVTMSMPPECQPGEPCDDGLYCTDGDTCGADYCCQSGPARDCNDDVMCTVDTCDEANDVCVHTPDHSRCNDGYYCNGEETCDEVLDCLSGSYPCTNPAKPVCDEGNDRCVECLDDEDCDDDGLYCNGVRPCVSNICQPPVDPCDDGVDCTNDSCDEETDTCTNEPDDAFCNASGNSDCWVRTCSWRQGCVPTWVPDCNDNLILDTCDVDSEDPDGDTVVWDDGDPQDGIPDACKGACCLPTGVPEGECLDVLSSYACTRPAQFAGNGTDCSSFKCSPFTVPTTSEWAAAMTVIIVMTGATLAIRRRRYGTI